MHPTVVAALRDAGFADVLKAHRPGDIRRFMETCGLLAEGCVSTGWCAFVWGMHNFLIERYPDAVQAAVWSTPNPSFVSASLGPVGRAERLDGSGACVSGRWQFASGSDHADWFLLGFQPEVGEPRLGLFHHDEVAIDDTWYVIGLRGTGSKDVVCDRATIPAERVLPFSEVITPYQALLILVIVGPVIGGAQAAVDHYRDHIGADVARRGESHPEVSAAMLRYAEAAAEVDAARSLVLDDADILDVEPIPDAATAARIVRNTAFAAVLCNRAVRRIFEAVGGSALRDTHPLQRLYRDVTAGCAHARLRWEPQALWFARDRVIS